MEQTRSLYRQLSSEWHQVGSGRAARRAMQRWADAQPSLRGFSTPAEVVTFCHASAGAEASRPLRALVAVGEALSARTVLQAMLPGLAAMSRRARRRWPWMFDPSCDGPWSGWGFDHDAVATAHARIVAWAQDPPQWPTTTILDVTWRHLRWLEFRHRQEHALACLQHWGVEPAGPLVEATPSERLDEHPATSDPQLTTAQELATLLREAVRSGAVSDRGAALVYETWIVGRSCREIARRSGEGERRLREHRERAERQLRALQQAS